MNERLIGKREVPEDLRNISRTVGDIAILVSEVIEQKGLPFGRVEVALPKTEERPAVVVYADKAPLAHPGSTYHTMNRELQAKGFPPENGNLRNAVNEALKPYVLFVEEQEPGFKDYGL